ncbi:MAG: TIGR03960 family B12-binding radical SAM protein [Nitrospirota bacterium]|nr:TIGR03960 family B12-binding radical SAM protein [Nitrospirota bacterium]
MTWKLKEKARKRLDAETGTITKSPGGKLRVALVYPNTYYVGMSNLGFQTVYNLFNRRDDVVCERAFLPDPDDLAEHERTSTELFTIESQTPLSSFDLVAFSLHFEPDYANVLKVLDLARLPLLSAERGDADPFVLVGGVCAFFNPEPMADFADFFAVGEGECFVDAIVEGLERLRGQPRKEVLEGLSEIPGIYVPRFYEPVYNDDGTVARYSPEMPHFLKRHVDDIEQWDTSSVILTDDTEFGRMYLVEASRGCGRNCRFCLAGYIALPPKYRGLDYLARKMREAAAITDRIGLIGAALSDHPFIRQFCKGLEGVKLSVSSLRADGISEELITALENSGDKTVTFAPEAATDRLRRVINKGVSERDILGAVRTICEHRIPNIKLYFMVGLPTETQEDVDAILDLARKVRKVQEEIGAKLGRVGKLTLSVNAFVPKPHTPFQWYPMEEVVSLEKKMKYLSREATRIPGTSMVHGTPKWDLMQAVLARGDRRVGRFVMALYRAGGNVRRAFAESGIDATFYATRERGKDEVFPWEVVSLGVDREFFRREYERGLKGEYTAPCPERNCVRCGVC